MKKVDQALNGNPLTIHRACAGGCGEIIEYTVASAADSGSNRYAPDVFPTSGSRVAFMGGHLCTDCTHAVENALAHRAEARAKAKAGGK